MTLAGFALGCLVLGLLAQVGADTTEELEAVQYVWQNFWICILLAIWIVGSGPAWLAVIIGAITWLAVCVWID